MIYLGFTNNQKIEAIDQYCISHGITKVFILSPEKFKIEYNNYNAETIEYADIIEYKYFYRLLQEVDNSTLIVISECMRTQNRYDLTYNCIRNFLNQTTHQLIFQYLPIIDSINDFMILFDFDTRSRYKREKFNLTLLKESTIESRNVNLTLNAINVPTSPKLQALYQHEKQKLINNIGLKDPHTIPRNLYLMSGKARLSFIEQEQWYIGRNNRFSIETLQTYKESIYSQAPYTIFEFCHNFIDFIDFMSLSKQSTFDVLITDLKVDQWYLQRYTEWSERIANAYTSICQRQECFASGA